MLAYIHLPFCRRRCTYCAFHSYVPTTRDQMTAYVATLVQEIQLWGKRLNRPALNTLYFGGGTPSLLDLRELMKIYSAIRNSFSLPKVLECTLEANPESIADWNFVNGLHSIGINRLSLGVQSLYKNQLKTLGRTHTTGQIRKAYDMARKAGFKNISFDLIWGLPKERLNTWIKQLREIAEMKPEHLSCYGLSLEPGTHLEKISHEIDMEFAPQDEQAKMYIHAIEFLESKGFIQYEISNFAKMGYNSRHNTGYWNGEDYLGFGESAVSTYQGRRWENPRDYARYADRVKKGTIGAGAEVLDHTTRVKELLMLRLRTNRGLALAEYTKLTGRKFTQDFGAMLKVLRQKELIRMRNGQLWLSSTGMLVSDTILSNLFAAEVLEQKPL